MTSSTTQPAWSTGGREAEGRGYGLLLFAAVLLLVLGFFNMIYGIAAIANSHVFTANAHYVIGDLRAWGWITLILSVLQLVAAAGILAGNQLARWFAVAVVGLNAICYRPRYLNIQRLNYLWTIRHSSARIAGNLVT